MDLLAGYSSDEDDAVGMAGVEQPPPKTAGAAQPLKGRPAGAAAAAPAAAAAQQPAPQRLPLPAEFLEPGGQVQGSTAAARDSSKRMFNSLVGHTLASAAGGAKASKQSEAANPRAAAARAGGGSKLLLPPQLSGRSNTVTEDLEKMFTQRSSPAGKDGPKT